MIHVVKLIRGADPVDSSFLFRLSLSRRQKQSGQLQIDVEEAMEAASSATELDDLTPRRRIKLYSKLMDSLVKPEQHSLAAPSLLNPSHVRRVARLSSCSS